MSIVRDILHTARQQLSSITDTPSQDSQVLLASVLGCTKTWILSHPEFPVPEEQESEFRSRLLRLRQGEPLPYILGSWEFYGLSFHVTPAVLIPRPETELLVDHALAFGNARAPLRFADVGTGSGIIAVTVAKHLPQAIGWAVDINAAALAVAAHNAQRHAVSARVTFSQSDLLAAVPVVDLICANLPYISDAELPHLEVSHHEPMLALMGGDLDGLGLTRRLLTQLEDHLAPRGCVLLEIGAGQGLTGWEAARQLAPCCSWRVLSDWGGRARLLMGTAGSRA